MKRLANTVSKKTTCGRLRSQFFDTVISVCTLSIIINFYWLFKSELVYCIHASCAWVHQTTYVCMYMYTCKCFYIALINNGRRLFAKIYQRYIHWFLGRGRSKEPLSYPNRNFKYFYRIYRRKKTRVRNTFQLVFAILWSVVKTWLSNLPYVRTVSHLSIK